MSDILGLFAALCFLGFIAIMQGIQIDDLQDRLEKIETVTNDD